jgi:hypothetical protein
MTHPPRGHRRPAVTAACLAVLVWVGGLQQWSAGFQVAV